MIQLLYGVFILGGAAVALFFFRYWRKSHDRLFAIMAIAFSLLTVERAVLAFVPPWYEGRHWIYLARLVAFVLIILGIIDKNRPLRKSPSASETRSETSRPEPTARP
jgi:hypothetical protein